MFGLLRRGLSRTRRCEDENEYQGGSTRKIRASGHDQNDAPEEGIRSTRRSLGNWRHDWVVGITVALDGTSPHPRLATAGPGSPSASLWRPMQHLHHLRGHLGDSAALDLTGHLGHPHQLRLRPAGFAAGPHGAGESSWGEGRRRTSVVALKAVGCPSAWSHHLAGLTRTRCAGHPENRMRKEACSCPTTAGGAGSSIDNRHLLLVGAGPGLGMAVARRFAEGGYRVTLVARGTDGLRDLADGLADTGARIDTIVADASDPDALGARMAELYGEEGAPGLIIYNAVMGAPDKLLSRASSTCGRPIRSTSSAPSS